VATCQTREHRKYGQTSHSRLQSNRVWDVINNFRNEGVRGRE